MPRHSGVGRSLGARLALAFLAVALGSLVLFAALLLFAASRDVTNLSHQQQEDTTTAVTHAASAAYAASGGWKGADLDIAVTLARDAHAEVAILDNAGRPVVGSPTPRAGRHIRLATLRVRGEDVGTARISFPSDSLPSADRHLRDVLIATIAAAAGLGAFLALGVSVVVARRISRPLAALITGARALEAGDRAARVDALRGPGELRELATAFNRMADAMAREDEMRRALVADVAHELRTPLTLMLATIEGLGEGVIDPSPAHLTSLRDDTLRLAKLVEDLEALAAADAAGLSLDLADVDLTEVTHEVVADLLPQFEAADVRLELRARPAPIRADRRRINQIVTNLLSNALKFTSSGGTVSVTVDPTDGMAQLVVTDTGIGIPPEDQAHIFERFWRGNRSRGIAGSGVGLTVVSELVEAHHGDIRVDSEPGAGTRVTVAFSIERSKELEQMKSMPLLRSRLS